MHGPVLDPSPSGRGKDMPVKFGRNGGLRRWRGIGREIRVGEGRGGELHRLTS